MTTTSGRFVLELERRHRGVVRPPQGPAKDADRRDLDLEEVPRQHPLHLHRGVVRGHNVKKEVVLPGLYEDVRVDDLKHDLTEARFD